MTNSAEFPYAVRCPEHNLTKDQGGKDSATHTWRQRTLEDAERYVAKHNAKYKGHHAAIHAKEGNND